MGSSQFKRRTEQMPINEKKNTTNTNQGREEHNKYQSTKRRRQKIPINKKKNTTNTNQRREEHNKYQSTKK